MNDTTYLLILVVAFILITVISPINRFNHYGYYANADPKIVDAYLIYKIISGTLAFILVCILFMKKDIKKLFDF